MKYIFWLYLKALLKLFELYNDPGMVGWFDFFFSKVLLKISQIFLIFLKQILKKSRLLNYLLLIHSFSEAVL